VRLRSIYWWFWFNDTIYWWATNRGRKWLANPGLFTRSSTSSGKAMVDFVEEQRWKLTDDQAVRRPNERSALYRARYCPLRWF